MSLLDELNPACPRGCGRTMDDCHESEDGGECEGGELLRENQRLTSELARVEGLLDASLTKRDKLSHELREVRASAAQLRGELAEAMRQLDEAQHKWQTLEQELADANRDRDGALADYDRVSGELVLWHEAFGADTIRDVNRIVPGACLRCGGLEGTHIKRDCLPSQAVVSEAVAHAEESDEDLGDSDTINLPSLAKVVKTGTTVWEPLRSAEVAVFEAADTFRHIVDNPKWTGYFDAWQALIAAVDARRELIAKSSVNADGPEQTDEPKAHAYSSHGWPCCDDAPAEQPRLVAKCGGPGLCTLCKVWANQVHLGFPMVRDGDDGPASSVSAQAEAGGNG